MKKAILSAAVLAALAVLAAGCGGSSAPCAPPSTLMSLIETEPIQESVELFTIEQSKQYKVSAEDVELGKSILYQVGQAYLSPDIVLIEFVVGPGFDTPFGAALDNPDKADAFLGVFTRDCAGDEWSVEYRSVKTGATDLTKLANQLRKAGDPA